MRVPSRREAYLPSQKLRTMPSYTLAAVVIHASNRSRTRLHCPRQESQDPATSETPHHASIAAIQGEEERDHHQSKTSARARGPHRTTDAGDANNPLGRSSLSTSKCIDYHADKPIVRTPRPQDYDVKVAGNHVNEIHDFRKQLNFLG